MENLLISFDLDETLFHSKTRPINGLKEDLFFDKYYTYFRPGSLDLLRKISKDKSFDIGIYTASTKDYAEYILSHLLPKDLEILYLFDRNRLVFPEYQNSDIYRYSGEREHLKDLKKVKIHTGRSLNRIIAVDDKPNLYARQYSNVLRIPRFEGDPKDDYLDKLWIYLNKLKIKDNVRSLEKRDWLQQI